MRTLVDRRREKMKSQTVTYGDLWQQLSRTKTKQRHQIHPSHQMIILLLFYHAMFQLRNERFPYSARVNKNEANPPSIESRI